MFSRLNVIKINLFYNQLHQAKEEQANAVYYEVEKVGYKHENVVSYL